MEIYKWKWMVLGALRCMNNADLDKKNIVLVCLLFSEITTITSILKNTISRIHTPSK